MDLSSGGSLFDIEAPAPVVAVSLPATRTASDPEPEPAPDVRVSQRLSGQRARGQEQAAAAPSAPPSGADLSRAALFADPDDAAAPEEPTEEPEPEPQAEDTADDPETILDSDDEPEAEEPQDDEPSEEKPRREAGSRLGRTRPHAAYGRRHQRLGVPLRPLTSQPAR